MKKKSHERSPDKTGFSVALPKKLVAEIKQIAKDETRSRNGQIERFLEECVMRYKAGSRLESAEDEDGFGNNRKTVPMIAALKDTEKQQQEKAKSSLFGHA